MIFTPDTTESSSKLSVAEEEIPPVPGSGDAILPRRKGCWQW